MQERTREEQQSGHGNQPYVAPEIQIMYVPIASFCVGSGITHGQSKMTVDDYADEGNTDIGTDVVIQ